RAATNNPLRISAVLDLVLPVWRQFVAQGCFARSVTAISVSANSQGLQQRKETHSNANYEKHSLASNTAYGYIRWIRPRTRDVYADHSIFQGDERCLRLRLVGQWRRHQSRGALLSLGILGWTLVAYLLLANARDNCFDRERRAMGLTWEVQG